MVRILLMQSNQKLRKIKAREAIDEVARAKKEAMIESRMRQQKKKLQKRK